MVKMAVAEITPIKMDKIILEISVDRNNDK
jgi:hypothetical protein